VAPAAVLEAVAPPGVMAGTCPANGWSLFFELEKIWRNILREYLRGNLHIFPSNWRLF